MEEVLSGLNKNLQKNKSTFAKDELKNDESNEKKFLRVWQQKNLFLIACWIIENAFLSSIKMSSLLISRQFFHYTYLVCIQYNLQLTISWQLNTKEMNNAYLPNHAIWYNFKDTHIIIIIYASIILRPQQQTNKSQEKL